MSEIKAGDLVRVAKVATCCGNPEGFGWIGNAGFPPKWADLVDCKICGAFDTNVSNYFDVNGKAFHRLALKKIDPPATGELDGVPVRKSDKVVA